MSDCSIESAGETFAQLGDQPFDVIEENFCFSQRGDELRIRHKTTLAAKISRTKRFFEMAASAL